MSMTMLFMYQKYTSACLSFHCEMFYFLTTSNICGQKCLSCLNYYQPWATPTFCDPHDIPSIKQSCDCFTKAKILLIFKGSALHLCFSNYICILALSPCSMKLKNSVLRPHIQWCEHHLITSPPKISALSRSARLTFSSISSS